MMKKIAKACCFLLFICTSFSYAEIIDREGDGFLDSQESGYILHLKGSPYERGYQHGRLLRDRIQLNISTYIDKDSSAAPQENIAAERTAKFLQHLPTLLQYVPKHFLEEMQGLSDGSGVPLKKIVLLNLFPEMFHCSGITVSASATKDHELYHVRVLDYSIGKNLQQTAVLMVVEPNEAISYLNVSYAGFIGSITGMNSQKIALGEIGGQGYGEWNGVPMAFLLREILEKASTLEEAKQILSTSPRTCEYYYVLSDGKTDEALAVYATPQTIQFIAPGESFSSFDNAVHLGEGISNEALLLTGNYPVLHERLAQNWGKLDANALIEVIKQPVSRPSNLHNAIFLPHDLKVWISHAGPEGEPACDQPYSEFSLSELLKSR